MRILFVSNPVGPLGTGMGGGVELTMRNAARALIQRNHHISVIAPRGSHMPEVELIEVHGDPQPSAQHIDRAAEVCMPPDSVIAAMWQCARRHTNDHCIAVNFAYDWLPFYLTPFLGMPTAHLVSMGSLLDSMDIVIGQAALEAPGSVAMHTRAQADTFSFGSQCRIIGNGLDLELYPYAEQALPRLCWVGRIAPEKGLEDAVAAAAQSGFPLDVLGLMQDQAYWQRVIAGRPDADVHYHGFLETADMVRVLRRARALLVTPKWVEAFGNVVMEALACGVPVLAYRRGGPAELIADGHSGCLVDPDDVAGMIAAIGRIDSLSRQACRDQAERDFSLEAFGDRLEHWFAGLVTRAGVTEPPASLPRAGALRASS